MEKIQFIFYLILGIIWLVIRAANKGNKNKQKQRTRPNQGSSNQPQTSTRSGQGAKSFEELLRELGKESNQNRPTESSRREAEVHKQPPRPLEEAKPRYVDRYDEANAGRFPEAQSLENLDEVEHDMEKTLQRIRERRSDDGRFKEFALEEKHDNYYANLLRSSNGIRDAIVLNAILNRPYDDSNGPQQSL